MGKKLLSIGIPSIVERSKQLNRLLGELEKQIKENKCDELIEIIVAVDNREIPVYEKCNKMIEESNGEYMVGLGDDDWVAPTYIKDIMDIVKLRKYDHITFNMVYKINKIMEFSSKYKHFSHIYPINIKVRWGDHTNDETVMLYKEKILLKNKFLIILFSIIFKRFIKKSTSHTWSTMVLKSDIGKKVKYKNVSSEEDMIWGLTISEKKLIKKEYNIKKNLYYYRYNKKFSSINKKNVVVEKINHKIQPIDDKIVKFI